MAGDERTEDPSCRSGLCTVGDGVRLYHEIRGCGAATLLLIPGASGDGGVFAAAARCLADRFTVVAYDRRARSRSPRPAGWSRTSVDEQADDAAALLRALGLAPAHVFGTSSGATIALNLALRHPQVVRSARSRTSRRRSACCPSATRSWPTCARACRLHAAAAGRRPRWPISWPG